MRKIFAIEDNVILQDLFNRYFKNKFKFDFLKIDDLVLKAKEITTKNENILVDISRKRNYITTCSTIINLFPNKRNILLIVNGKQYMALKNNKKLRPLIIQPKTINEIASYFKA